MSVCVRVESVGQRVPEADLAGLSRVIDSTASCQMPLSCHGGSPTLLRVFSDTRVDGREFLMYREFDAEVFLYCFRLAHQEVFGGLETTTMVDYLVLRLRGALQESWCESVPNLRRCIVAGRVDFVDLRAVVTDLIAVWSSVQDFVRHTGPRHFKTGAGRVRNSLSFFSFFSHSGIFHVGFIVHVIKNGSLVVLAVCCRCVALIGMSTLSLLANCVWAGSCISSNSVSMILVSSFLGFSCSVFVMCYFLCARSGWGKHCFFSSMLVIGRYIVFQTRVRSRNSWLVALTTGFIVIWKFANLSTVCCRAVASSVLFPVWMHGRSIWTRQN